MRFPWFSSIVTVAIVVAMLLPSESIPKVGVSGGDVAVHVLVFAAWSLAVSREFSTTSVVVFASGMLLAVGTELLQIPVPGRMFSMWDILIDAVGLGVGIALSMLWDARRSQDNSAKSALAAGESQANAS